VGIKYQVALFFVFGGRKLAIIHSLIQHLVHPSFDHLVHLLVFVLLGADVSGPLAIHLYQSCGIIEDLSLAGTSILGCWFSVCARDLVSKLV
jgi:hypothetical protein